MLVHQVQAMRTHRDVEGQPRHAWPKWLFCLKAQVNRCKWMVEFSNILHKRQAAGLDCADMQKQWVHTSAKMCSFLRWQATNESLLRKFLRPTAQGGAAFYPNPHHLRARLQSVPFLAFLSPWPKHATNMVAFLKPLCVSSKLEGASLRETPVLASAAVTSRAGARHHSCGCG